MTAIIISASGYNAGEVYVGLLKGGFGSLNNMGLTLNQATPLLFCSLGLIFAFRCGVWNIGAEGQLYMGALGAFLVGYYVTGVPKPVHLFLVVVSSFVFGGAWGVIPGVLKVKFKVNEMVTSLLLSFIAWWIIAYLVKFPLRVEELYIWTVSNEIAPTARLPLLMSGVSAHAGILIAIGLSVAVWFIMQKTVLGYEIKAVGVNPNAAAYGGIAVGKTTIIAMILSGGLCGLAGMAQVSGIHYVLADYLSSHYGFLAIMTTFIAELNPYIAVIVCIFFGGLLSGSHFVQMKVGIDGTIVQVLLVVMMLFLMAVPLIQRRLSRIS
ncbi:ABC transporter permease [Chloroflexota bacterium]